MSSGPREPLKHHHGTLTDQMSQIVRRSQSPSLRSLFDMLVPSCRLVTIPVSAATRAVRCDTKTDTHHHSWRCSSLFLVLGVSRLLQVVSVASTHPPTNKIVHPVAEAVLPSSWYWQAIAVRQVAHRLPLLHKLGPFIRTSWLNVCRRSSSTARSRCIKLPDLSIPQ